VRFLFAGCVLDTERRELTRGSERVAVGPQVFDLLVYLVQNRERVITKDDMLAAVWSGRIVSESTLTSHVNAVRKAIGDNGEDQRLIRTLARKGLRFVGEVEEQHAPANPGVAAAGDDARQPEPPRAASAPALPLPDKPSIAVLPFENMSGNPEQEYFVDGLVEDITTSLSCIPSLFVIARNSAFTYKGRAVDVSQVGRELGVRYVLEGSVRQAGGRLRITVQLVSAETRRHLWAKRFDGAAADVFDLQDRVTEEVVGAVTPRFEAAEVDRARRKRPGSLDAWDLVLRALPLVYSMTREGQEEALGLLARSIALDPDYALPLGLAAWCRTLRVPQRWGDPAEEAREGLALARRALVTGPDDAEALVMAGYALGFLGRDPAAGLAPIDRAHGLNPNSARGFTFSGWLRSYKGEHEVATAHFTRALRLSPLDLQAFRTRAGLAFAHLFAGRLEAAVDAAQRALEEQPNFSPAHRALATALAHLGRTEEAREVVRRALAVVPGLTTTYAVAETRFSRLEDRALLEMGLRRAGLPE